MFLLPIVLPIVFRDPGFLVEVSCGTICIVYILPIVLPIVLPLELPYSGGGLPCYSEWFPSRVTGDDAAPAASASH